MGMHKEQWSRQQRQQRYIESLTEGFDHSGLRKKYRSQWLCRVCSSLVMPGERHGHGRFESR